MPVELINLQPADSSGKLDTEVFVWRYMPFIRLLDILDNKLYFSQVGKINAVNDPMECVSVAHPSDLMAVLQDEAKGDYSTWHNEIMGEAPEWLKKLCTIENDANQAQAIANAHDIFAKRCRAVSCWFSGENESAGMWKSFANDGVAIKIQLKWLINTLNSVERRIAVAPVQYLSRANIPMPFGSSGKRPALVRRPYFAKGKEFEHEREIRFVTPCSGDCGGGVLLNVVGLRDIIDTIYISPYLDKASIDRLKNHIDEIGRKDWKDRRLDRVKESTISHQGGSYSGLGRKFAELFDKQFVPVIPP